MKRILTGGRQIVQHRLLPMLLVSIGSFILGFHVHFTLLGSDDSNMLDPTQCDCLDSSTSNSNRVANGAMVARAGSRVKILCMIMSMQSNFYWRARHVKDTWAKRCDNFIFMSSVNDTTMPAVDLQVPEGSDYLWARTKAAFTYAYNNHLNDSDFFLKADDDTYMVMENLRDMLTGADPNKPLYAGRRMRPFVRQGFMFGGSGYVLSREAVRRFVDDAQETGKSACRKEGSGPEDVRMGACLEMLGVKVLDSRDHLGRERFHPLWPEHHLEPSGISRNHWIWSYNYYALQRGDDGCSDTSVSFHYISPGRMRALEYIIYRLPRSRHAAEKIVAPAAAAAAGEAILSD